MYGDLMEHELNEIRIELVQINKNLQNIANILNALYRIRQKEK